MKRIIERLCRHFLHKPASGRVVLALCTAGLVAAANTASAALDLETVPLFAGTSAPPNIMVAIDDSGSMDYEILVSADDGMLYWDIDNHTVMANGVYHAPSRTPDRRLVPYSYLFPNGCNNNQNLGRRIYCDFGHNAVPPIPQFGFARSAEYNMAYFDPSESYTAWEGEEYPDAPATNARTEPNATTTVNLTADVKKNGTGELFLATRGMLVSAGTEVYYDGQWYGVPADMLSDEVLPEGAVVEVGVKYFPATFYLKPGGDITLPADYGYIGPTIAGKGPNGEDLDGYEIKPSYFTGGATGTAYKKAIQNFANWFTYYRKRSLATRGGIVAAFSAIEGVRVGSCTINRRQPLNMRMLEEDDPDARAAFYSDIFNINYYQARGTPNRKGLQFLGQQLENNDSIITAPCQRNYAILFTDGYNNDGVLTEVGNTDQPYGAPFADSYSNTIADVAMRYYQDLDTPNWAAGLIKPEDGCQEANPDPSLNCKTDLHMTTFGVTLGQQGTIFGNPLFAQQNADPYNNPPNWPNPLQSNYGSEQVDDLWHATINSHGELLNARTPTEISNRFLNALDRILGEIGSGSGVTLNSATLTSDTRAYRASFNSGSWTGELAALPQSTTDGSFGDPAWLASEKLAATPPGERVIIYNGFYNCGNDRTRIKPFRTNQIQKCHDIGLTKDVVNYVRGDSSNERANGGTMRNRKGKRLGDIVHSTPLYVGAPNRFRYPQDWNDLRTPTNDRTAEDRVTAYSAPGENSFAQGAAASRTPMIYAGANDGMLHGFDANTGEERLAFIPHAVGPRLVDLTEPNYAHQYYLDGTPNAGDVPWSGAWHTVLVSGLRGGGRSVFALDITDPEIFSEDRANQIFLWEYTDPYLGYTYGKPSIVRLHNGDWAAVFGNGYNSCDTSAQLFIVEIQSGDLIKRIDTSATTPAGRRSATSGTANCQGPARRDGGREDEDDEDDGGSTDTVYNNGLGEVFPVDLDGDFITDYVYAGDLQGNIWKFDLTSTNKTNWKIGLNKKPLFTTPGTTGKPQAITTQPQVGVHPYGSRYGVMVYFGTGKYIESDDRYPKLGTQNSFYGIWDLDVFTFNEANADKPLFATSLKSEIPRSRLVEQTLEDVASEYDPGVIYRLVSDNEVPYQTSTSDTAGKRGWFIDLPDGQGEMSVTNARLGGGTIAFSTTVPSTETCNAGGSGFFMLLDAATGGRVDQPVFDINGDGQFDNTDKFDINGVRGGASGISLSGGVPGEAAHQVDHREKQSYYLIPASDGSIRKVLTPTSIDRRRSWREIRR